MAMIGSRMRPGDKLAAIWVPYAGLCVIVLVFAICMALVVMTFAKI